VTESRQAFERKQITDAEVPSAMDSLKNTHKFLTTLMEQGITLHSNRWRGSIETCKETATLMQNEMSKLGFASTLRLAKATELQVEGTRKELEAKLTEWLAASDLEQTFPDDVQEAARVLLVDIRDIVTQVDGGFSSQTCADFGSLMGKLVEMLDVKKEERAKWCPVLRLMGTSNKARTDTNSYSALGHDAPSRVAADADNKKLLELQSLKKAIEAQERQVDEQCNKDNGLTTLKEVMDKYLRDDAPSIYNAAKASVEAILAQPVDTESVPTRSLQEVHAGTFDGSDWHKFLADDMSFKKIHEQATKTVLTINPKKFKLSVGKLCDSVEAAKKAREQFDTPADCTWEKNMDTLCRKALVTEKEGQLLALLHVHKTDPNTAQAKARIEKNKANRPPKVWQDMHTSIRGFCDTAISRMPYN